MALFDHPEFHGHEQVVFCHDRDAGLKAIIAIHDTTRGPAVGGCRMWPYASEEAALTDVAVATLAPIADEMNRLLAEPGHIEQILRDGGDRAAALAGETLAGVHRIMGLLKP